MALCSIARLGAWLPTFIVLATMCISWVAASELVQSLQLGWDKPFLTTYVINSCYAVALVPWWWLRQRRRRRRAASSGHLEYAVPTRQLVILGVCLQALSAVNNSTWFVSLPETLVSANNAVYQSSSAFVFVLSVFLLGERVTATKLAAVGLCVAGVVLVSTASKAGEQAEGGEGGGSQSPVVQTVRGYVMCVVSTAGYSLLQVVYGKATTVTLASVRQWWDCVYFSPWPTAATTANKDVAKPPAEPVPAAASVATQAAPLAGELDGDGWDTGSLQVQVHNTPLPQADGSGTASADGSPSAASPLSHDSEGQSPSTASTTDSLAPSPVPPTPPDAHVVAGPSLPPETSPAAAALKDNLLNVETAALIMGVMGVATIVTLWPLLLVLHATGVETLAPVPPLKARQLALAALLDGAYEVALLYGITITSALWMSVGTIMVVPASIVADLVLHGTGVSFQAGCGVFAIVAGFASLQVKDLPARMAELQASCHRRRPPN